MVVNHETNLLSLLVHDRTKFVKYKQNVLQCPNCKNLQSKPGPSRAGEHGALQCINAEAPDQNARRHSAQQARKRGTRTRHTWSPAIIQSQQRRLVKPIRLEPLNVTSPGQRRTPPIHLSRTEYAARSADDTHTTAQPPAGAEEERDASIQAVPTVIVGVAVVVRAGRSEREPERLKRGVWEGARAWPRLRLAPD